MSTSCNKGTVASGKARDLELTSRDTRVLELRVQGFSFEQIAQEVRFSGPSGAWQSYQRIKKQMIFEPLEELRQLELMRLDMAQHALWNRVINGDLPAVNCVLKIMDQRAKLVGLYKPEKIEVNKRGYEGIDIEEAKKSILTYLEEGEPEEKFQ